MAGKRDTVMVIEDEPDILEVMEYNLQKEGYRVRSSRDGEEGLRMIREQAPDLVLLDRMLPGLDGVEICRRMKQDPLTRAIPIIMVTAKGEETDVVVGLSVGADDYVTKPFRPKELLARVDAVLRRAPLREDSGGSERIVRAGLTIDAGRHEVRVDGEPQTFTATELRLLHFLASHPGRVFPRDHLLSRVIGEDAVVLDRNIDVHIGAVRKKLGPYRDLIQTVRGVGYRFRDADE
jgi:two-component system alkaline phosphatase synthesis response regulator PhoP